MTASLHPKEANLEVTVSQTEVSPWATMWRPAPADLVEDWRSLSRKAQGSVMVALDSLRRGEPSLHLSDCELKSAGAKLVAEAMRRHPGLRNLTLSHNGIGDDGAVYLAEVIRSQHELQMVCLSFNCMGDAGARALALALEQHQSIRLLSLDGNRIGDAGAHQLIGALVCNKRISIACSMATNPAPHMSLRATRDLQTSAATVRALSDRGITLGQMLTFYAVGCRKGTIIPAQTTSAEVAGQIILPATATSAVSYVEAGLASNHPPTTHVIHSWSSLFRDLLFNLASHATGKFVPDLEPDGDFWRFLPKIQKRSYFVDLFCVNQHVSMNSLRDYGLRDDRVFKTGEAGCQIDKLHLVAQNIQRRGGKVLLSVDSGHKVLTRFLSLQELHAALETGLDLEAFFTTIDIPPNGWSFVKMEDAKADDVRSREIALDEMRDKGFETFNGVIQEFLDKQYAQVLEMKFRQFSDPRAISA